MNILMSLFRWSLPPAKGKYSPLFAASCDANLDRAREGLRIIEEWCRFGLNSVQLSAECKQLRQELASWHSPELRAREIPPEILVLSLPIPKKNNVLTCNCCCKLTCRVQEALRVLEEYGKLYHPKMGGAFKQMRYQVYTLESRLLGYQRHQLLLQSHLYLVSFPSETLFNVVEAALVGD